MAGRRRWWTGAVDRRAGCVVSVVGGSATASAGCGACAGPTNGTTCWIVSAADRVRRALEGDSELVERTEVLLPDRQSAALAAASRRNVKGAIDTLPLEYVDETLAFNPEWVVDRISPRPVLFIATDNDRLVPPEESRALYEKAGEPRKLVVLKGYGHYEVYTEPRLRRGDGGDPGVVRRAFAGRAGGVMKRTLIAGAIVVFRGLRRAGACEARLDGPRRTARCCRKMPAEIVLTFSKRLRLTRVRMTRDTGKAVDLEAGKSLRHALRHPGEGWRQGPIPGRVARARGGRARDARRVSPSG